jgi:hypothetical protein
VSSDGFQKRSELRSGLVASLSGMSEKQVCVVGPTENRGVPVESLAHSLLIAKWRVNVVLVADEATKVPLLEGRAHRTSRTLRMKSTVIATNPTVS